jgi:hypothetical protein
MLLAVAEGPLVLSLAGKQDSRAALTRGRCRQGMIMPRMSPEAEAAYALDYGVSRSDLSQAAQLAYDRLRQEREAGLPGRPAPSEEASSTRTPPEVRARILEMFKRGNSKYAKPFEKDRLATVSVMGGNWEEYGQIILQMAILDTLLSIEEHLTSGSRDETIASE